MDKEDSAVMVPEYSVAKGLDSLVNIFQESHCPSGLSYLNNSGKADN